MDDDWTWSEESLCVYGSSKGLKGSEKIASFDMDDTIITRKSGAKFPKDAYDWIFWKPLVPAKIK
jgi:bifunctional polynucleotide phosphatase/kinase